MVLCASLDPFPDPEEPEKGDKDNKDGLRDIDVGLIEMLRGVDTNQKERYHTQEIQTIDKDDTQKTSQCLLGCFCRKCENCAKE